MICCDVSQAKGLIEEKESLWLDHWMWQFDLDLVECVGGMKFRELKGRMQSSRSEFRNGGSSFDGFFMAARPVCWARIHRA